MTHPRIPAKLALAAIALAAVGANLAQANVGCCMKRDAPGAPWIQVGTDFAQCEADNRGEGDDVFAASGLVWWNIDC